MMHEDANEAMSRRGPGPDDDATFGDERHEDANKAARKDRREQSIDDIVRSTDLAKLEKLANGGSFRAHQYHLLSSL